MAYYRPIYDSARDEEYLTARSNEHEYNVVHVRAAAIVPNHAHFAMAGGMYPELNPDYSDVCPPPQMDHDIFQQHHQLTPVYPEQYSSPVDTHSQQLSAAHYGAQPTDQRTFSPPGMSESAGDLRNMGIYSHASANADSRASSSPRGHISSANRPDMQWMVTTSHIDMRTLTPPNAVMSHSGLVSRSGPNSAVATITHSGYSHGGPSSSIAEQKPIARNKNGKPKGTPGRKRKVQDYELAPEEAAKRHVRRERNKLAAAKCRNRRRDLTDRLQGETDILEDHQGMLTQEIIDLQQEKDHLEFILASHSSVCKVLQDKSLNLMRNHSPTSVQCSNSNDCMGMQDHGDQCADLMAPIEVTGGRGGRQQATTVSVIQAGPSLSGSLNRSMNENIFPSQNNSVIVGNENMMHAQYSMQSEDPRYTMQSSEQEGRFSAALANLDVLDQVVAGEPLNTPVCTLATPSNTSAVFTFPNTPCVTSSSMASSGMSFPDTFSSADYNYSTSGSVMSTGNFLHPKHGQYNFAGGSIETCSAAHRRNSSSESHHSTDSVQSPTLLSL